MEPSNLNGRAIEQIVEALTSIGAPQSGAEVKILYGEAQRLVDNRANWLRACGAVPEAPKASEVRTQAQKKEEPWAPAGFTRGVGVDEGYYVRVGGKSASDPLPNADPQDGPYVHAEKLAAEANRAGADAAQSANVVLDAAVGSGQSKELMQRAIEAERKSVRAEMLAAASSAQYGHIRDVPTETLLSAWRKDATEVNAATAPQMSRSEVLAERAAKMKADGMTAQPLTGMLTMCLDRLGKLEQSLSEFRNDVKDAGDLRGMSLDVDVACKVQYKLVDHEGLSIEYLGVLGHDGWKLCGLFAGKTLFYREMRLHHFNYVWQREQINAKATF